MHTLEGFGIYNDQFLNPLKSKKDNIGSLENPKFANIEDYWDDETVENIKDLLQEFQDIFPTKFSGMKSIIRDLG